MKRIVWHKKKSFFYCIYLALFALLLISCQTTSKKKDGPPNFYVDETKIPDAVPKKEKLAKFGNMPVYRVFGKRYYVMRTYHHYEAVGTASWYGTLFHNRRTSSGELYNMLAMTAAHRTLPLPSYVEVTNLANHRKIIVKVNDRGPFSGNRLIDLSYVAAKKLGMLGRGTATVKIRVIDPDRQFISVNKNRCKPCMLPKTNSFMGTTKPLYLQVGAFKNRMNALELKKQLQTVTSAPIIISSNHLHIYRVKIGPIQGSRAASQLTGQLKHLGIKANKAYGA